MKITLNTKNVKISSKVYISKTIFLGSADSVKAIDLQSRPLKAGSPLFPPPNYIWKLALERLTPFTFTKCPRDKSRKGSSKGQVIGHWKGVIDLQPWLAPMETKLWKKILNNAGIPALGYRASEKEETKYKYADHVI